jgi:hypothetical protein
MKDNQRDRDNLKTVANALADLLHRHTTLHQPKRMVAYRAWEDGWYITVATLSETISIAVFSQCWISPDTRNYWVGFASSDKSEIGRIVMSSGLPIGGAYEDSPDPPKNRQLPIQEWLSVDAAYFGIYMEPSADFDMGRALHFLFDVLQTMPRFANSFRLDDKGLDIAALEYDPSLDAPTRKQLIDARIGQGIYRQQLEKLWGGKCAVLGITNRRVLRASHVKAWRYANKKEKLDPHNGLLLAAHLDALFDALLITFTPSGDMIVADELSEADRKLLTMGSRLMHEPPPKLRSYLQYHRDAFEARHSKPKSKVDV